MPIRKEELKMGKFEANLIKSYLQDAENKVKFVKDECIEYEKIIRQIGESIRRIQKNENMDNVTKTKSTESLYRKREQLEKRKEHYETLEKIYDSIDKCYLVIDAIDYKIFEDIVINGKSQKELMIDKGQNSRQIANAVTRTLNRIYDGIEKDDLRKIKVSMPTNMIK